MNSAPASRRRTAWTVAGIVTASVLLYAGVVTLYAFSGQVQIESSSAGEPEPDPRTDVLLTLVPEAVDAVGNRLDLTLDVADGPPVDVLAATEDFSVLIAPTDGARSIDYAADRVISPSPVRLVTTGEVEAWPFDVYTVQARMLAYRVVDGEAEPYPTYISGDGRVLGWNIVGESETVEVDGMSFEVATFTIRRSGSTIAFGIVLLSLMVVMPVLVLTVAITAFRRRRKVEATLTSWIGAMLFATIPLRNFLPGSPPIGSWVDYLVVLWVIAGLMAGLVIFVISWLRFGPAGPADRTALAPPETAPAAD